MLPFGFFFFFWGAASQHAASYLPDQGIKLWAPAVEEQSLNHGTTREVPVLLLLGSFGPWGSAPTSVLNLVGDLASGIHRMAPSVSGPGWAVVSLSDIPILSLAALFVRAPVTCSVSVLHSA